MEHLVPLVGISTGIIIPVSVFIWLYYDAKGKRDAVVEIAKHMDDPKKTEQLLTLFDERKKEPIDYRRGGVITIFVGIGLYLLGATALGALLEGVGLLVGVIGVGTLIAGYLYPNTSQEITNAVERFEGD
jgi:amino acid transporter